MFKYYSVIRTDLTPDMGLYYGKTELKKFGKLENAEKFAAEWEEEWKKNKEEGKSIQHHCWIDCRGKLEIKEIIIELDD